jgi:hypothetical protein
MGGSLSDSRRSYGRREQRRQRQLACSGYAWRSITSVRARAASDLRQRRHGPAALRRVRLPDWRRRDREHGDRRLSWLRAALPGGAILEALQGDVSSTTSHHAASRFGRSRQTMRKGNSRRSTARQRRSTCTTRRMRKSPADRSRTDRRSRKHAGSGNLARASARMLRSTIKCARLTR